MERFRQRVESVYGVGAYDLEYSQFKGNTVPMAILCPDHGFFHITPDNFLYNRGCPECRGNHPRGYPDGSKRLGIRPRGRPAVRHTFYVHAVGDRFIKIGITSFDVEKRRVQIARASDYAHSIVYLKTFQSRRLCAAVEKLIKSLYPMGVAPCGSVRDGSTEVTHLAFLPEIVALLDAIPSVSRG